MHLQSLLRLRYSAWPAQSQTCTTPRSDTVSIRSPTGTKTGGGAHCSVSGERKLPRPEMGAAKLQSGLKTDRPSSAELQSHLSARCTNTRPRATNPPSKGSPARPRTVRPVTKPTQPDSVYRPAPWCSTHPVPTHNRRNWPAGERAINPPHCLTSGNLEMSQH